MLSKKQVYHWHRKAGLTLGFFLFLMAISGIAITYRDELLPLTYPELIQVKPATVRLPAHQLLANASAVVPANTLTHLYTSERDDSATMVFYRPTGSWLPHLLTLNPYSGELLGSMPLVQNIFGVMLYLHANFFLGKWGGYFVGLLGLVLTAFFVSGVYLWWPKANWAARLRGFKQGTRGLHRLLGVVFGPFLVFSALTGLILAFDLGQSLGNLRGHALRPAELKTVAACDFNRQMEFLKTLSPLQEQYLVSIHLCSKKNALMKVSHGLNERSGHDGYVRLLIDPASFQTVQRFDTSTDPAHWSVNTQVIYPLHSGSYFGGLGRALNVLTGFALATLFITGLVPKFRRSTFISRKGKPASSLTQGVLYEENVFNGPRS